MSRALAVAALLFALAGFGFAAVSTYDFAAHLDREVHGIHCSFLPSGTVDTEEASGCAATLMSPYSSFARTEVWGGIPISLLGMGLFAFLAFLSSALLVTGTERGRTQTTVVLAAWAVPLSTSIVMGLIAATQLDAFCKLCVGIYAASAFGFMVALGLFAVARMGEAPPEEPPLSPYVAAIAIPVAGLFVALPVIAYTVGMPDYEAFIEGCGSLSHPEDRYRVFVPLDDSEGGTAALEILDPLCSSCRGLEERLAASGLDQRLDREALLFPLDDACNWMVSSALHPGSCSVAEAMLCEPDSARAILDWSFARQGEIMEAEQAREGAAAELVGAAFPSVRSCVGTARVRSRLHRGLRWAVANRLPVLTPQLFIHGDKVCNEDTDLGLEYIVSRMLAQADPAASPGANTGGGAR